MIGTIYTTRLLPSLDIIDELKGSKGRSVGHMYEMNIGQEMKGAHRAGTDVNGVVDILCDKRVTQKIQLMQAQSLWSLGWNTATIQKQGWTGRQR